MKEAMIAAIALSTILGLTSVAVPIEQALCLPPGVTETDLKTWKPLNAQQRVVSGENGEPVNLVLMSLQNPTGDIVLGWVGDVVVYFDWKPDDASVAPLVNNQMVTAGNLMRTAPVGPCVWRQVKSPATAV